MVIKFVSKKMMTLFKQIFLLYEKQGNVEVNEENCFKIQHRLKMLNLYSYCH